MVLTVATQQLVGGFNRREPRAIARIYETCGPEVLKTVSRLTDNSPDTDDLVADIFVKLLMHTGRFQTIKKIKDFLFVTARNVSLDYRKHQSLVKAKSGEISRLYESNDEPSTEAAETTAIYRSRIYEAVDRLPTQCREVFLLYYAWEFSNEQIARKLGIAEKTVANHKSNAVKKLKIECKKMNIHYRTALTFLI